MIHKHLKSNKPVLQHTHIQVKVVIVLAVTTLPNINTSNSDEFAQKQIKKVEFHSSKLEEILLLMKIAAQQVTPEQLFRRLVNYELIHCNM